MYELLRKTLIILICLMLSKTLHMTVGVYLLLFAILLSTTTVSKHIHQLLGKLLPAVICALGATLVNQAFSEHPFIIWTCCLVFFDHVRRQANTNLKIGQAVLPLFMIIFVTTYHNSGTYTDALIFYMHDVVLSAGVVAFVTSFMNHIMPPKSAPSAPQVIHQPVTGSDRLKILVLVGGGLAFIMINQVTSAVFCLVPLVTSAMQPTHQHMKQHSKEKLLSQIGGCCLAIIMSMVYSGTEVNLFSYALISFLLIYLILYWIQHSEPVDKAIHGDALMGFLIPYQLYIAQYGNNFGLNSITLRATELMIALVIIYIVAHWLDSLARHRPPAQ
ncbi:MULTISPECIES: DUF2955 domain-containing protein [unclassified Vibrio]|uniref:DUF2955 domain-containing protein n=1 Tax=Vibrio sp. HB236076 TaxID=3232307 RepID=A0AB39HJK3_9VIBR|nr:DUF2955 domain-containing protein [Vibrio sp. HB161653]MDP5253082.1 DUF2955 domain-containing protein [Vibrio sp. HB161653]